VYLLNEGMHHIRIAVNCAPSKMLFYLLIFFYKGELENKKKSFLNNFYLVKQLTIEFMMLSGKSLYKKMKIQDGSIGFFFKVWLPFFIDTNTSTLTPLTR
jgi:hypothetical protein